MAAGPAAVLVRLAEGCRCVVWMAGLGETGLASRRGRAAVFVTTRTMPAGAPYSVGRLGQSASAIGAAGGNCRLEPLNRKRPMHGVGLFHGVSSSCVFRVLGFVDINSQTLAIRGISIPSTLFVESELHCSVQWNQTDRRAGRVPALTLGRRPGP